MSEPSTPPLHIEPPGAVSETIPAGQFKAKCLALMDRVNETGARITITKNGHPVAMLVPYEPEGRYPILRGSCKDEITIHDDYDLTRPTFDESEWIDGWNAKWDAILSPPGGDSTRET